MRPYTHMILSGAGMAGIAYLGILRYLHQEGYTDRIRHVAGTSMGAFFATLWAVGAPMGDLEGYLKEYVSTSANMIISFQDKGDRLIGILKEYMPEEATFLDIAKQHGCHLAICASCMDTLEPMFFSVNNSPNIRVIDAVKASMSIPFMFEPVVIDGKRYVDGGLTANTPLRAFGKRALQPDSTLVVQCTNASSTAASAAAASTIATLIDMAFKNYIYVLPDEMEAVKLVLDKSPIPFIPFEYITNPLAQLVVKVCVSHKDIEDSIGYGFQAMHTHSRRLSGL